MDEEKQTTQSLKSIYAISFPIFSHGSMQMFGFIQCTTGQSMLLVVPNDVVTVNCPLCGRIHTIKKSFIRLTIEEFLKEFKQSNFDDRG
jgi:hypothetical protein